MSPASGDGKTVRCMVFQNSFHSINVPSEWGLHTTCSNEIFTKVSIQLMSPASGDKQPTQQQVCHTDSVSIQLMSPASGD